MKDFTNNRWRIALAALLLVGGTGTAWAQQGAKQVTLPPATRNEIADSPEVLEGLKGVLIAVGSLSDDAKKMGLTEERLQSAVELSLRRNGVPVLTKEERLVTPGRPFVFVSVNVLGPAYMVYFTLREDVRRERDPGTRVAGAATWTTRSGSTAGIHGSDAGFIVKQVETFADEFCHAYREVGQRKPSSPPVLPELVKTVVSNEAEVLQGVKKLQVWVSVLDENRDDPNKSFAATMGVTESRVQKMVDAALRRTSVRVLKPEERFGAPDRATLDIYVNIAELTQSRKPTERGRTVGAGFDDHVELHENVRLERSPTTLVFGATVWRTDGLGLQLGTSKVTGDFIVKSVEQSIDKFCLDYLKANPK